MINPYQNLANAIVIQAARDYRKVLKKIKHSPDNDAALKSKAEIEKFFRSRWFRTLTTYDAEQLIEKLQEGVR